MYTSLAEIQVQREEEIARNPISNPEADILQTPTETLYQVMLHYFIFSLLLFSSSCYYVIFVLFLLLTVSVIY